LYENNNKPKKDPLQLEVHFKKTDVHEKNKGGDSEQIIKRKKRECLFCIIEGERPCQRGDRHQLGSSRRTLPLEPVESFTQRSNRTQSTKVIN